MIDQEAAKKHFVEGAERLGPTYKQATEYFNARPQTKAEIIRGIARVGATPQALYQRCVQLYPGVQIRYEVPLNFNLNVLTFIAGRLGISIAQHVGTAQGQFEGRAVMLRGLGGITERNFRIAFLNSMMEIDNKVYDLFVKGTAELQDHVVGLAFFTTMRYIQARGLAVGLGLVQIWGEGDMERARYLAFMGKETSNTILAGGIVAMAQELFGKGAEEDVSPEMLEVGVKLYKAVIDGLGKYLNDHGKLKLRTVWDQ